MIEFCIIVFSVLFGFWLLLMVALVRSQGKEITRLYRELERAKELAVEIDRYYYEKEKQKSQCK